MRLTGLKPLQDQPINSLWVTVVNPDEKRLLKLTPSGQMQVYAVISIKNKQMHGHVTSRVQQNKENKKKAPVDLTVSYLSNICDR